MPDGEVPRERGEGRRGGNGGTGGTAGAPPRLRFHVAHHLKLLLVLNILPILAGIWFAWQINTGRASLKAFSQESKTTLVIVLIAGVIFALTTWFVMPVARWVRDYPTWHLRRGPAWAWIIPTCGGWVAWLALSTAGMLAAAAAILVAGMGIWHLFQQAP